MKKMHGAAAEQSSTRNPCSHETCQPKARTPLLDFPVLLLLSIRLLPPQPSLLGASCNAQTKTNAAEGQKIKFPKQKS